MSKSFFTYAGILCVVQLAAQHADAVQLREIEVTDFRSKLASSAFNEVRADSSDRHALRFASAAQLLLQLNTCFVKSYGPANIASLSVRGSTAQQTAVVWNGVNINNPMLGQTDVSLLPLALFNDVAVQRGALSGLWGSGAMAGVLSLGSGTSKHALLVKGGAAYSSMRNAVQFAAADVSVGKWSAASKLFADYSENAYAYYDADSLTILTQQHARTRQHALMQDVGYRISERQHVVMHVWLQESRRQIPYTVQEVKDDAGQRDALARVLADWKLEQKNYSLVARSGWFSEQLTYTNTTYHISSRSRFNTYLADLEAQVHLPHDFTLTAGSNNALSTAISDGYSKEQQFSRAAIFTTIEWKRRRWNATAFGRAEAFQWQTIVPGGGVNVSCQLHRLLQLRVNGGTIYRYPTLNDLYWNPGGNPELKPEKGYSGEGSAIFLLAHHKLLLQCTGTIFTRTVNNWIMWLPGKHGVWSPQNVLQVWSRGAETNSQLSFSGKAFKASLQVNTNYVLSARTRVTLENDESAGMQLPYVPMYSGSSILLLAYKNVSARIAWSYTGYRYLTSDNYEYLEPYHLTDIRLAYTVCLKNVTLDLFAEANNLFNANYFSVAQYAMPLRYFRAGIQVQYLKPKHTS